MEEDPLPILDILNQVDFHFLNLESLFYSLIICILLICSAFISGAEVAYFSLTRTDLERLKKEGKVRDQ